MSQLEEDYGKTNANIIYDNCGNTFIGITKSLTGERVSKELGQYETKETSLTKHKEAKIIPKPFVINLILLFDQKKYRIKRQESLLDE